jgi:hypothetical protein
MNKPDLIVIWPDTIDYPLFREWVRNERERFAKVIVVFTATNWPFTKMPAFIQEAMKHAGISFMPCDPIEGRDWRDVATRQALGASDSEWVLFTEQDFFPNKNLWEELEKITNVDVIGVMQEKRLHPCCLFIKRQALDTTSKNFAAHPPAFDHFGQIQEDLFWAHKFNRIAILDPKLYYHMNGLTHNMFLLQSGKEITFYPEEFKDYLRKCLSSSVPLHEEFQKTVKEYLA